MITYARMATLRSARNLRGRGAVACAIVVPTAVACIVHAPPPFGASGDPPALVLAVTVAGALTCCLGVALLAAFMVGDEWERGRARALRAAGLDVPAMIVGQSLFVAGSATILSVLAFVGPCLLSLGGVPLAAWHPHVEGVFAASLVSGLFGLGLPLVAPRWAATGMSLLFAVFAAGIGSGLDESTRDARLVWLAGLLAAVAILVMGALRTRHRLDQGIA